MHPKLNNIHLTTIKKIKNGGIMNKELILDLIETLEKKNVGFQLSVEGDKTLEITVKDKKIDINIVNPSKIGLLIKELDLK